jgi:hypothetical protein
LLLQTQSFAGEIPGLPYSLPPYVDRRLELTLSNDFFGNGGSVDDFRTQQITLTVKPVARWTLLLDHSVLTLRDAANPGRTDQLSGSLGYDLISRNEPGHNGRLSVGAGFRSTGDFAGERIQNGFHQLIGSDIRILPYTGIERTDATAWFDAEYYTVMREAGESSMFGDWRIGSWLRVNSLVTSDAQWDGSAALFAVANRRAIDLWFGLRRDWRNGYDDPVVRETASAEDDLAVVLGVRFGALVLETVQQLNNDASYGQIRLLSTGESRHSSSGQQPRIGIEAGIILPDAHLHFAVRKRTSLITADSSDWRESAFVSIDYGEPQHRDNNLVFIRSLQLGIGLEWERFLSAQGSWLSAYGSLGAGWREETLIGDGVFAGEKSSSVGRAVLLLGAGFRVDAAKLNEKWNFRIQLGVSGWIPESDTELPIGAMTLPVQEPALNLALGMTFDME